MFDSRWNHMRPNTSHVTLQEAINLGHKVRDFVEPTKRMTFFDHLVKHNPPITTQKYLQRNPTADEKTIASVEKIGLSAGEKMRYHHHVL